MSSSTHPELSGPCRRPALLRAGAGDQRGSILVPGAVFLFVGLILLGAVQLGYLYYAQRQLQNAADLAALSGAQSLWQGCAGAGNDATTVAAANFASAHVEPVCGTWSATGGFGSSATAPYNAMRIDAGVAIQPMVPFMSPITLDAQAQAVVKPVAAFSVGSRLLSVQNGLLAAILSSAGLDPAKLTVLDSAGIANVDIQPSGLLEALGLPASVVAGVGTPDQLASLQNLTLGQLLDATATVVGQSDTGLVAAIGLLKTAALATQPIALFGQAGVIALPSDDPWSALNTQISVADLIKTALVVANRKQALQLSLANPLLTSPVTVTVVNPPTIEVGGIGTQATNAQIQARIPLEINIKILNISLLKLPLSITLQAVQSTGTLEDMCAAPLANNQARIGVVSKLADVQASILNVPVSLGLGGSGASDVVLAAPGAATVAAPGLGVSDLIGSLISAILGQGLGSLITSAVLKPLLSPLDPLLQGVLDLLGLSINQTDVRLYSVNCAAVRLVY